MSRQALNNLADEAGILHQWQDAHGQNMTLDQEVLRELLRALALPADSPGQIHSSLMLARQRRRDADRGPLIIADAGRPIDMHGRLPPGSYCQLQQENGTLVELQLDSHGYLPGQPFGYHLLNCGDQQWQLACAPPACPSVAELTGRQHIWGIAAQVYSLRRAGDAGLGDTSALWQLARSAAAQGADVLAISPLHAMFNTRPEQYSPYSPSSRNLFNILHADPAQLLGEDRVQQALRDCGLTGQARYLEQQKLIDWPAVTALRLTLLRHLHQQLGELPVPLQQDFTAFRQQGGPQLQQHCCHQALQQAMLERGHGDDWRHWPSALRQPDSTEVNQFAEQQAPTLEFHAFTQWLIQRSLTQIQQELTEQDSPMSIGLLADMAIGADPSGSFAWACQKQLLSKVSIGAPPDLLNRQGQNWGVAAFCPLGLRQHGYSALIAMLRANLACSGGLRIDHIMGLQRLWIIPDGASPHQGAYLNYPLDDLLRLLALEATRHRALIIGEDLGTVPAGLQSILAQRDILGMRVLQFEQQEQGLPPPERWSEQALATTATHDLPSTLGWLAGRDIDWREQVGQSDAEQSQADRRQRQQQIQLLDQALRQQDLLSADDDRQRLSACIRFLGRTPAPLVLLPLEDVMASEEQPNLPGADNRLHPNWRRRWPQPAAEMLNQPGPRQRLQALDRERQQRHRKPDHD